MRGMLSRLYGFLGTWVVPDQEGEVDERDGQMKTQKIGGD